eukprot:TRINITY_DN7565_c0_g1_i1.p1 TRINITY_DN7565_c0_g1~~TRINITY_DN7565_c0_g1_i1.p1  ORF type:complete len:334 (+),score=86.93 TRINITY_DN7565_c0_g1_i1:29-1003(+)
MDLSFRRPELITTLTSPLLNFGKKWVVGLLLLGGYYLLAKYWDLRPKKTQPNNSFVFNSEGLKLIYTATDPSKYVMHQSASPGMSLCTAHFGTPTLTEALEKAELLRLVLRNTEASLIATQAEASKHLNLYQLAQQRFLAESQLRQDAESGLEMEKEMRRRLEDQLRLLKRELSKRKEQNEKLGEVLESLSSEEWEAKDYDTSLNEELEASRKELVLERAAREEAEEGRRALQLKFREEKKLMESLSTPHVEFDYVPQQPLEFKKFEAVGATPFLPLPPQETVLAPTQGIVTTETSSSSPENGQASWPCSVYYKFVGFRTPAQS